MSTLRPSLAFASCATILVVSLAFAFYRRHSTCPLPVDALPAPAAVAVPKAELQVAAIEPAMAPVRTLVSDTESLRRIAELEAEVSRLRAEVARLESEAAAVRFASTLTTLAPEDMVEPTLFLASTASRAITGQMLAVDGGVVGTGG